MARFNELTQDQKTFVKEAKAQILLGYKIASPGDPSTDLALDMVADVAYEGDGFNKDVAETAINKKKCSEKQAFIIAMGLVQSQAFDRWHQKLMVQSQ